jgi:hypothetical protein
MAEKTLSRIEIVIVKDVATSEVSAQCSGVYNVAELNNSRLGESMGISGPGVDAILDECTAGLKAHLASDGAHTVVDAQPKAEE